MRLVLLLLLVPFFAFGQLSDDFSDGDLNNGIIWSGDTNDFKVNRNKQLQLNSSGEGVSVITTPLTGLAQEWIFWVKMSFSPSDNNNCRVFLASDNSDFSSPLNGFYLKLGETGVSDAIELYRQTGTSHILVARGGDGYLAKAFSIRIKITRDDGQWEIWADSTGNNAYQFQATGTDETWNDGKFFGIECNYTSSNATKFYFDDVYAGPLIIDATPPQLISVSAIDNNKIELKFNEPVSNVSASNTDNYELNTNLLEPVAAGQNPDKPSSIHVLFNTAFEENTIYTITVKNITDLSGNVMNPAMVNFQYAPVREFDVLFNEIMADPDPPRELTCEYIELHNRTNHSIQLTDYSLFIGSTEKPLPEFTIPANGYYILTAPGNDTIMQEYGNVLAITGFSLINTGCRITLKNSDDGIIHSVAFTDEWYHDTRKSQGGWSIELIDPLNPCNDYDNWNACMKTMGGTPGAVNSINNENPDNQSPTIDYIMAMSETEIEVVFNESLDSLTLSDTYSYEINNEIGFPVSVNPIPPEYKSVILNLNQPIDKYVLYSLTIKGNIEDCAGNIFDETKITEFGWPFAPAPGNLAFNEILFDPLTDGADFIEIYNNSDSIIDMRNVRLVFYDTLNHSIESDYILCDDGRSIFPHSYLVLTGNAEGVKNDYFIPSPSSIIGTNDFPALPNNGSTLCLVNRDDEILDMVSYNAEMHFPLLTSTKGVSLEKIDLLRKSNIKSNWHSASLSVGFASPGYKNSQFMASHQQENIVNIEPATFSPDNDGRDDNLLISFSSSEPGNLITIRIFDGYGRLVRILAANHLAGDDNSFVWDGVTDSKEIANSGIYVVLTEIVNIKGTVNSYKNAVVVAAFN